MIKRPFFCVSALVCATFVIFFDRAASSAEIELTVTSNEYSVCDASSPKLIALREHYNRSYHEHIYTHRGIDAMYEIMPPFVNLPAMLKEGCSHPNFRLLEQGCGSGHFLLHTKALCPAMRINGANFKGYTGFGQVDGTPSMMLAIAEYFKVPVMCNSTGDPAFPDVQLTVSIASPKFSYLKTFGVRFDVIVSRDALNAGKLLSEQSHVYIPRMLAALKGGGTIVVQTDYGAEFVYHDVPKFEKKEFTILGIFNTPYRKGTVSIMLYKRRYVAKFGNEDFQRMAEKNFYASYFGLVIRKCRPGQLVLADRGCIIPPEYENRYPEDLQLWKADYSTWRPENDPEYQAFMTYKGRQQFNISNYAVDYTCAYHDNLRRVLKKWEVEGIPDLVTGGKLKRHHQSQANAEHEPKPPEAQADLH